MYVHRTSLKTLSMLAALAISSTGFAQGLAAPYQTMTPIYLGSANMLGMINATKQTQDIVARGNARSTARSNPVAPSGGRYAAAPSSAVAQANGFGIANDAATTAQARTAFLAGLAQNSGQAAADEVDHRLGNIRTTFARVVGPYGLRADDLADVTTAYMVIMWMAANRQVELPSVNQVQAVRQQMRGVMAGKLDDAQQRQLLAETMMYQTCMAVIVREQAQAQHKPELLDALAAELDKNSNQSSGQLRQLALTDTGLTRR